MTAMLNGIAFLDVDQVLNGPESWRVPHDGCIIPMDPLYGARVARICAEGTAGIVLATTWLGNHTVKQMTALLRDVGVTAPVYGSIGYRLSCEHYGRGKGCEAWLMAHPDVTRYVVLDDSRSDYCTPDGDPLPWARGHLVCPSNGIEEWHVTEAIEILRNGGKKP